MDVLVLYAFSRGWCCFALGDVSMGRGWVDCVPCLAGLRSGKKRTVPAVVSALSALQAEGEEGLIRNGMRERLGHGWEWRRGGCDGAAVPPLGEEGQRVLGTMAEGAGDHGSTGRERLWGCRGSSLCRSPLSQRAQSPVP